MIIDIVTFFAIAINEGRNNFCFSLLFEVVPQSVFYPLNHFIRVG